MIVKLALQVTQKVPKQLVLPLLEAEDKVIHVPRPADEQTTRKKNPVRIIE